MTDILTTPVNIPNINRIRVNSVTVDQDASIVYVRVVATQIGGNVYGTYILQAINGSSIGIRANGTPTGPTDALQQFTASTPTAFTDISAAFATVGTLAAKNLAVETACITAGLLPVGTVT